MSPSPNAGYLTPPPINPGGSVNAPEPLQGDSLTQWIRANANYAQQQGQGTFNYGQDVTGGALHDLGKSSDYWTAILSGDPQKIQQAIAPYANTVAQNYNAARTSAQGSMPRGGYASTLTANLPFAQARDINNYAMGLQPQAAGALAGNAGVGGGIGQGLMGAGQNLWNMATQAQLERRGQNVNEHGQALGLAGQLGGSTIGAGGRIIGG